MWSAVTSPAGVLSGVAAFAADDVWAVGGSGGDPLALHWDGMTWTDTDAPTPSPGVASFSAVAGSGPDDVWAVGVWDPITDQTFIEHWDGMAWSIVPSPNPPTSASTSFTGVSVVSATDAWAVGVDGYDGDALIARYAEGEFTTALQVRAPPPITVGDPSSVQGTLTFSGNAPAGGQTIHVARTNPDATVTDLGDVGTIWPGGFAVSDTPPVRGTYTYTASFDGNGTYPAATGSAQLTVLGTPVQLSIAASAHHLVIGKAVTLTARLSLHQAGRSVSLLGKVPGRWLDAGRGRHRRRQRQVLGPDPAGLQRDLPGALRWRRDVRPGDQRRDVGDAWPRSSRSGRSAGTRRRPASACTTSPRRAPRRSTATVP